jgi:hypothetical protein
MKPVVTLNLLFVKWKYIVKYVVYANPKEAHRQRKRKWEWYAKKIKMRLHSARSFILTLMYSVIVLAG